MFLNYIIFFFVTLFIGGLSCIGLWWSSRGEEEIDPEGNKRVVWSNILYPLYRLLSNPKKIVVGEKTYHKENWWAKPIIGCFMCYASFWGTIIYLIMASEAVRYGYIKFDIQTLIIFWVFYCFSLVTINTFLENITRD